MHVVDHYRVHIFYSTPFCTPNFHAAKAKTTCWDDLHTALTATWSPQKTSLGHSDEDQSHGNETLACNSADFTITQIQLYSYIIYIYTYVYACI